MAAAKLRVKYVKFLIAVLLFFFTPLILFAEQYEDSFINMQSTAAVDAVRRPLPVYLSELSNINDYTLFANGGWDGNWYIGFNVCWMEEIPVPPQGEYSRVFIGAKIGRMKTRVTAGKPVWEREPIPGDIYISLSSTCAWKNSQGYFLAESIDIPLESDLENAIEGAGESRWFWTEVPIKAVNFKGPNFLALWSPSEYFVSTASSPILAGGWGSSKVNSWMNNDVRGYPPINPLTSLKTSISTFEPALAMKLIPAGSEQTIVIKIDSVKEGRDKTQNKTFTASITGEEIEKAWIELSADGTKWKKHGRYIYSAPYMFTMKPDNLSNGIIKVRCGACDIWGNVGYSDAVEMLISTQILQ